MVEPVAARYVLANASYPERVQHAQANVGDQAQQQFAQQLEHQAARQRDQVKRTERGEDLRVRPEEERRRGREGGTPEEESEDEEESAERRRERLPVIPGGGRLIDIVA